MSVEYGVSRVLSGRHLLIYNLDKSNSIISGLVYETFTDKISFKKNDQMVHWNIDALNFLSIPQKYSRLSDLRMTCLDNLAKKIYNETFAEEDFLSKTVDLTKYRSKEKHVQILEELSVLQETEKNLISSGKLYLMMNF